MSRLDDLKASPDTGLTETTVRVCVSGKLVAELEAADAVLFEHEQTIEALLHSPPEQPEVRRAGASSDAALRADLEAARQAAEEAAATCDEIRDRMTSHTVDLTLRAKPSGEWRQWALKHPARDEDEDPAGHARDHGYAGSMVDLDALCNDLHLWIAAYDGEAPSDEWWQLVATNGAAAHLRDAATKVVAMHEQRVEPGKSRTAWLADRRSATN